MLVASFTKSGGSWLCWLLTDMLYKPNFFCDQVPKSQVDKFVTKTEYVIPGKIPRVHLIRHPLDICCSAFNYMLLTNRAEESESAEFYDSFITSGGIIPKFKKHSWKSFIEWGQTATYQVLYDELVNNPVPNLTRITGLDPTESLEKYSVEKLREREKSVDASKIGRPTNKKYTFFNECSSFYYPKYLSEEQVRLGQSIFREEIEQYWPETLI